jgi:hypothetical protein
MTFMKSLAKGILLVLVSSLAAANLLMFLVVLRILFF